MGWKGFTISIPAGMLFRKMFCHKCGAPLKKEKIVFDEEKEQKIIIPPLMKTKYKK